jgi:hypothetical protein
MATLGPAAQETSSTAYIILAEYVHNRWPQARIEVVCSRAHKASHTWTNRPGGEIRPLDPTAAGVLRRAACCGFSLLGACHGVRASFCRNQRKKKALQDTKVKCEQLLSENRLLLEEREANQQETYEVTEFLRKEILRKNEKIASLEAILEQREILVEQEKAAFIKHAEHKVNGASWADSVVHLRCADVESLERFLNLHTRRVELKLKRQPISGETAVLTVGRWVGSGRRVQSSSSNGAHARASWWRKWST